MQKRLQPVRVLGWCLLIALVCFLIGRYPQDLFPAGPFEHEVDSLNFWYVIGVITDGVQWVLCFAAGWILAGKTGAAAGEYSRLWNGLLLGGSLVVLLLGMPELVGALTVLTPDAISVAYAHCPDVWPLWERFVFTSVTSPAALLSYWLCFLGYSLKINVLKNRGSC